MTDSIVITHQQRLILKILSDGEFHHFTDICQTLKLTPKETCNHMAQLNVLQLDMEIIHGLGCRISGGLELLNADKLKALLTANSLVHLNQLIIFYSIPSTNQYLLEHSDNSHGTVCLAEQQTAGRGRLGRKWLSPFGRNLYLSIRWEFTLSTAALAGLSLVIGVAVIRALTKSNITGVQLKWPNDIQYQGKKLAGILVETTQSKPDSCATVIGIGMNLNLPTAIAEKIQQPCIDIATITKQRPARHQLLASVLNEMFQLLPAFQKQGFAGFKEEWESYHAYAGQEVTLTTANGLQHGIVCGVDSAGCLQVSMDGVVQTFHSGEISVRLKHTV